MEKKLTTELKNDSTRNHLSATKWIELYYFTRGHAPRPLKVIGLMAEVIHQIDPVELYFPAH